MSLEELKKSLEERYMWVEAQAKNNTQERLKQIKLVIYAVQQYIRLQVQGLLDQESINKIVKLIKQRFNV